MQADRPRVRTKVAPVASAKRARPGARKSRVAASRGKRPRKGASPLQTSNAPKALLDLALRAALCGAKVAGEAFGKRQRVSLKADQSEVTAIDIATEKAIVAAIRGQRPFDRFIGEENTAGSKPAASSEFSGVYWIIDPIDGTRNFIRGVPLFAVSVAACVDGQPVAGAVIEPVTGRVYAALRGGGAFLDGRSIRIGPSPLARQGRNPQPIVAIPSARRQENEALVQRLVKTCIVRSLGAATLHLLMVATGGLDATFLNNCKIWDIAASALFLEEAGGCVAGPSGRPLFPVDLPARGQDEMPTVGAANRELLNWIVSQTAQA